MKRQSYYPSRAADEVIWLGNFAGKLPGYASTLTSLTAAQIAAGVAEARWLIYVIGTWLPAVRPFATSATEAVNLARSGDGLALSALTVFTPPALPVGVVPVKTGALDRLFELIDGIEKSVGYTESIGTDLRIIGTPEPAPDFTTLRPVLKASLNGGEVLIKWSWEGYGSVLDQCEIEVDRGDGKGWALLTFDTTPNYTDTAPHPSALTKWSYRAIYRVDDHRVGLWSEPASVAVGG